jgi:hypothetical protein
MPFRTVVKSFQVPVWQNIRQSWWEMNENQRGNLHSLCPLLKDSSFPTQTE